MNLRENTMAILHYQDYDRLPLVHFGYWPETLQKWREEGHITAEEETGYSDGNEIDDVICAKLGFDFCWSQIGGFTSLFPFFERKVIKDFGNGTRHVMNHEGVIELEKDAAGSIPMEIEHLLVDRPSWEEHYLPKLQFSPDRVNAAALEAYRRRNENRPVGLHVGSLFGNIRNWVGVEGVSYLMCDDEELYDEIIDTVGNLCYDVAAAALSTGVKFDYAHYWEDICFKNGPLVIPSVFEEKVGPHYRRMTSLLADNGIDIVSLDCDGCIDSLLPIWLENGVNTMFPIEVGTWDASIAPWREKYGNKLCGVGGMNKTVFAKDKAAVDAEVERLSTLVALGGYIPCPDHRIAPDAEWENVVYYTQRMREVFGG